MLAAEQQYYETLSIPSDFPDWSCHTRCERDHNLTRCGQGWTITLQISSYVQAQQQIKPNRNPRLSHSSSDHVPIPQESNNVLSTSTILLAAARFSPENPPSPDNPMSDHSPRLRLPPAPNNPIPTTLPKPGTQAGFSRCERPRSWIRRQMRRLDIRAMNPLSKKRD